MHYNSLLTFKCNHKSRRMTKPTKWPVRPEKTKISLGIRPVWSESLLCAQWVAKDPMFLHTDSDDSEQIGLSSLGAHVILLVLPYCGSIMIFETSKIGVQQILYKNIYKQLGLGLDCAVWSRSRHSGLG